MQPNKHALNAIQISSSTLLQGQDGSLSLSLSLSKKWQNGLGEGEKNGKLKEEGDRERESTKKGERGIDKKKKKIAREGIQQH